jgi:hypothetical protein
MLDLVKRSIKLIGELCFGGMLMRAMAICKDAIHSFHMVGRIRVMTRLLESNDARNAAHDRLKEWMLMCGMMV